jgi:Zn-dependent peptidase ImmA (M78 family)
MSQNPPSRRFHYLPKSRQEIARIARDLRKSLGIDDQFSPDLSLALFRIRAVFPNFKLKVVSDDALPHAEAKAFCKAYILKIRESVLKALDRYGDGRTRWTVAHEFGHLALQHPKNVFRKQPNEPIRKSDQHLEREANIFAAEFLMPPHLARKFTTADELSTRFQVSLEAASSRLRELQRDSIASKPPEHPLDGIGDTAGYSSAKNNSPPSNTAARAVAFVSMAFATEMDRLYQEVIRPSIEDAGVTCIRADEISSVELVTQDIRRTILDSTLMIAEISGFNPNVMHEIGLAHSLEKPTILICRQGYSEDQIPSNIRPIRRIMYPNDASGGPILRRHLTQTILSILNKCA